MTTPQHFDQGQTTRLDGGRIAFRMERLLPHPQAKVWRAITQPEHLSAWYPFPATELDLRPGGLIRFDDGEGGTMDGEITDLDPPKVFAFREVDDHLRLELSEDPSGCLLVLTHTFAESAGYENNAAGWSKCLDALAAHLAG